MEADLMGPFFLSQVRQAEFEEFDQKRQFLGVVWHGLLLLVGVQRSEKCRGRLRLTYKTIQTEQPKVFQDLDHPLASKRGKL